MNRVTLSAMSLLVLALGACGGPPQDERADNAAGNSAQGPKTIGPAGALTVAAGDVVDASNAGFLQGNFEIRPPRPGEEFVEQPTIGGACLVARIRGPNANTTPARKCRKDADCTGAYGSLKGAGGFDYCLAEHSDSTAGTCWVKPNGDYCVKGVGAGAHSTLPINPAAVRTYAQGVGAGTKVDWMVTACLNGQQVPNPDVPGTKIFPCAARNKNYPGAILMGDDGPVRQDK